MTAPALTVYQNGVIAVSADQLNTMVQSADTVTQLRTLTGAVGLTVLLRGINAIADGLGGAFYWSSSSTGPDDGLNTIVPTGCKLGAWVRFTLTFNVSGSINAAPYLQFAPTCNPPSTLGTLVVQATTSPIVTRQFLGSFGFTANSGVGNNTADKVALYAAIDGLSGASNIWSLNTLTTMELGFPAGSYALGYELDFNNFAASRGTTIGTGGFAGATSTGLLVTGASTYWNTSGISVEGNNSTQWERGISIINAGQAAFFDWSQATAGFISYGTHTYGIDLFPMTTLYGGNAIRMGSTAALVSRNAANTADLPLIYTNAQDNVTVGNSTSASTIFPSPNVIPGADNASVLGVASFRWQAVWAINGTIQTSDPSLKTDISPLPAALPIVRAIEPVTFKWLDGGSELQDDTERQTVHATEQQTIKVPVHTVINGVAMQDTRQETHTVHLYDEVPVQDAYGKPVIISVPEQPEVRDHAGKVVRPASPAHTFPKTHRVPRMVQQDVPIKRWVSRPGRRTHWGFLAPDVRDGFAKAAPGVDFGGYVKDENGTHHLRPDQLVPVLWKAVQELAAEVEALKKGAGP